MERAGSATTKSVRTMHPFDDILEQLDQAALSPELQMQLIAVVKDAKVMRTELDQIGDVLFDMGVGNVKWGPGIQQLREIAEDYF
jgi:hypothetical protein